VVDHLTSEGLAEQLKSDRRGLLPRHHCQTLVTTCLPTPHTTGSAGIQPSKLLSGDLVADLYQCCMSGGIRLDGVTAGRGAGVGDSVARQALPVAGTARIATASFSSSGRRIRRVVHRLGPEGRRLVFDGCYWAERDVPY